MADIAANSKTAIDTVDPTPYFQKYREHNVLGHASNRAALLGGVERLRNALQSSYRLTPHFR
jgi:hypothetical protein